MEEFIGCLGMEQPLTPRQIATAKDRDIDFSDIPELDDDFWRNAELVEPDRTVDPGHR